MPFWINILVGLLAFVIAALGGKALLPWLHKLKFGQPIKVNFGPSWHANKQGTPTMGGILFLIGITVTCLIYLRQYPKIVPVLFLTLGFGIIGFLDDYLKVVLRRSDGLYPKQKMLGQIIVTAVFVVYLWIQDPSSLEILIPFSGGKVLSGQTIKIASAVIAFPAIIGTVNGVNFGRACDRRDDDGSCVLYSGIGDFGCRN